MVRNISIAAVEDAPRPVVAVGNVYPDGHFIPPHRHRRGQLISCVGGTMVLATAQGTWVMPPQRGMWVPPGTVHDVRMIGTVSLQSLYIEPHMTGGLPVCCQVVGISPFIRALIVEALDLPLVYDTEGRSGALMTLLQHEMRRLPVLPLSLPLPERPDLAARCRVFLTHPRAHESIAGWCDALGMSRRSFTRIFRQQTGLSFAVWRQQACLVTALPRLASGEPITSVAMALGYDNPSAFTSMFKRLLGSSPRTYLCSEAHGRPNADSGFASPFA